MITTLLVLGATGDLTSRLLLPGLAGLATGDHLPDGFRIIGAGFEDVRDDDFRARVRDALITGLPDELDTSARERVAGIAASATYGQVDVTDDDAVRALVRDAAGDEAVAIYLALPTALIRECLQALDGVTLPPGSRIAVEKPFGHDSTSARRLDELLDRVVGDLGEQAVYRVDHVLAMTTLQNLLQLRLSNRLLAGSWNGDDIERVDILWEETIDANDRAGFYDRAGALRDVMQNHLVQVLCWVAMEPPASWDQDDVDAAKLEVLRHARVECGPDGRHLARRARYTAGTLAATGGAGGEKVVAYTDAEGVDPDRDTETLAEVTIRVDTLRWTDTVFVLRAGKALAARRKGVLLDYRTDPTSIPGSAAADGATTEDSKPRTDNRLWIGVDGPNDVRLGLVGATLGPPRSEVQLLMKAPIPPSQQSPYGNVLLDLLSGGKRFSVARDEPAQAWRLFEPVLAEWDDPEVPAVPVGEYEAGSAVPIVDDGSGPG